LRRLKFIICISLVLLLSGCGLNVNIRTSNNNLNSNPTVEKNLSDPTINMTSKDLLNIKDKLATLEKELAKDNSKDAIIQHLSNLKKESGLNMLSVYFGDELGNFYLVPTATLPADYDARERIWYKNAKENGEYVSDAFTDLSTTNKILGVAKAIYKDKKLIGVVGIDLVLESTTETK
jgi:methyl-accepting chemotaxis protein